MTTERAIEVLQEQAQTLRNLQALVQLSTEGLDRLQALDKAIEVMGYITQLEGLVEQVKEV